MEKTKLLACHQKKGVVRTMSQRWAIGCIDNISSLEMKVLLTSDGNVVATLRSDGSAI